MKETPERIQKLLKSLVDQFDKEDQTVRERQIRLYKKLKLYWNGFQRIWWDSVAHDWKSWDETSTIQDNDAVYYDKPVNLFRAYLESIIAALSINIPNIRCVPDDADNPLDISTAKAGNKIYQLVSKHNNANLLWLQALYIYCTEGLIHCYRYTKEDEKYGTYEENEYKDEEVEGYVCPVCQVRLADEIFTNIEMDEFGKNEDDVIIDDTINKKGPVCESCGAQLDPELMKTRLVVSKLVGVTRKAKSRQCLEILGGLFVRTPTYARRPEDMPYLCYSYETHYSNVVELYPHLRNKIGNIKSSFDNYERWGRLSTQYNADDTQDTPTVRNWWFRPSSFNVLKEEDCDELKEFYPAGVKVVFINDEFAEAENECLDDSWTLARNPLSDYIQYDPLGVLLVSIQDILNDLVALTLQTIEQGIPQNFADPAVLDFNAYRQQEATPGSVYPTKPVSSSKNISEAFTTLKTATLSQEVLPFFQNIQSLGQVTSGALPPIFGGASNAGSRTASEYSMSRSQALQRLQNSWKILTTFWKEIFGKVIPAYIKEVAEDERLVEKNNLGSYVNVYIRKAELQGKIGDIELEGSEQLPISWAQKRDIIKELMLTQLPGVMEALTSPENLTIVKEAFGLDEFIMPGEDDRQKQYEEIQELINSEPIPNPIPEQERLVLAQMGKNPMEELPSVDIDRDVDNHEVEASICKAWLISDAGRLARVENPTGRKNVLLHYKLHLEQIQLAQERMMMAQIAANEQSSNGNPKRPKESPKMPTKQIAAQAGDVNERIPIQ
jgi:hypothetical protein